MLLQRSDLAFKRTLGGNVSGSCDCVARTLLMARFFGFGDSDHFFANLWKLFKKQSDYDGRKAHQNRAAIPTNGVN